MLQQGFQPGRGLGREQDAMMSQDLSDPIAEKRATGERAPRPIQLRIKTVPDHFIPSGIIEICMIKTQHTDVRLDPIPLDFLSRVG